MTVPEWRRIQRQNFTRVIDLLRELNLDAPDVELSPRFAFNLPRRLASKIRTVGDPLFRQFVPLKCESASGGLRDPVADTCCTKAPRVLHKYAGRALLLPTSACAMHCRYCFRQHYPYEQQADMEPAIAYLRSDPTISEAILSGGDPLSLSNSALEAWFQALATIPHIRRIRFHTRFLMGIPERIDDGLLALFARCPQQLWIVVHTNHLREFDDDVWASIARMKSLGIPILTQSVLLRGVNDNVDAFTELCEALVDHGVVPYYIHQLDPVEGAMHFEVPDAEGLALLRALELRLPGYALPRYVRDVVGEKAKVRVGGIPPQLISIGSAAETGGLGSKSKAVDSGTSRFQ